MDNFQERNNGKSKFTRRILIVGLIIVFLAIFGVILYAAHTSGYNSGFNSGYTSGRSDTQKEDEQSLDEYFHNKYANGYKSEGSAFIDSIADKTKDDQNTREKLDRIASLMTRDFTDPFWSGKAESDGELPSRKYFYDLYNNSGGDYKPFVNIPSYSSAFWFEKRGNVRLRHMSNGSIYREPEWIASQNTGACHELSILFNATANKAGIETRAVRATGAYGGGGHVWNEVNISGKWMYYDVQEYGLKKNTNNSGDWFGNTRDYADIIQPGSPCEVMQKGVYILDIPTDGFIEPPITSAYDPDNRCPHGTWND
ncbi:MAG: transglutaminase-like domain-containing protein [Methanoregula sp.]|jgi:hypothetical protein